MGKLLHNKKMYIESPKKIIINNLEIGGSKMQEQYGKVGKNATIQFNTNELFIHNVTTSDLIKCYNIFEQSYISSNLIENIVVEDSIFICSNLHNILSLYNIVDNTTITFKNCIFEIGTACNPIRLSNLNSAKNVLITFDSCSWKYVGEMKGNEGYLALILLQQDGNNPIVGGNWKIVIKNCICNNSPITIETFNNYTELTTKYQTSTSIVENQNAILYYYKGKTLDPDIIENKKYFPEVRIISNNKIRSFKV